MALERDPNSSNLLYVESFDTESLMNIQVTVMEIAEDFGMFYFQQTGNPAALSMVVDASILTEGESYRLWFPEELADLIDVFIVFDGAPADGREITQVDANMTFGPIEDTNLFKPFRYFDFMWTSTSQTICSIIVAIYGNVPVGIYPFSLTTADVTEDSFAWESAYREAKIDLDPIFSSKLITVGQLSRLTGSGTASGAQADKLVTMGQLARLTGKQAPAEDKLVTVGQAYSVV